MNHLVDNNTAYLDDTHLDEIKQRYNILREEADLVRESDRNMISGLLQNFYGRKLDVGIGFKRAYGSILSGDYFELFKLPDNSYFFVFADICGHGLPAYTTLIRLRSAITLAIGEAAGHDSNRGLDRQELLCSIGHKFADLLKASGSSDFASVLFTFITRKDDKFILTFYNRGNLYPLIVRKFEDSPLGLYNLNEKRNDWVPTRGNLLGEDIRYITGAVYDDYPASEFVVYEGDSILYFTDGVIEAKSSKGSWQYGLGKLEKKLLDGMAHHVDSPQHIIDSIYSDIDKFMGDPSRQYDDMTAVLINLPLVR